MIHWNNLLHNIGRRNKLIKQIAQKGDCLSACEGKELVIGFKTRADKERFIKAGGLNVFRDVASSRFPLIRAVLTQPYLDAEFRKLAHELGGVVTSPTYEKGGG